MRMKDQEIKRLMMQIQKLKVIKETKEKKIAENEKSIQLQVLNEFDIEESINNLILENKEIMQQEQERKKKKTNSFSLENHVFEDNNNKSYGQNVTLDYPIKSISNKNPIRNSAKVLPNDIFHNLSEDENNGNKNMVVILIKY